MTALAVQILRFAAVGATATAVHVGAVLLLVEAAGAAPLAANALGFLAAVLVSYLGNRSWTFGARTEHLQGGVRFAAVALLGLGLNQSILYAGVRLLGWDYRLALLAVVLLVPGLSFVLVRAWAFGRTSALALGG